MTAICKFSFCLLSVFLKICALDYPEINLFSDLPELQANKEKKFLIHAPLLMRESVSESIPAHSHRC